MMEKYKLSVVIPIYKVEEYLDACVKSVITQDYKNLEVILVDDGSPDCCPQICDDLSKLDYRIKVIHKQNGGLSSARNAGIQLATGDYITFLDSDDRWDSAKLGGIMSKLVDVDVDMIFLKSLSCYTGGVLRERPDNEFFNYSDKIMSAEEIYALFIREGNMREQAGTHIVKTDFLVKHDLLFKEGILGEDTEWMFRAMRVVEKLLIINDHLQIYTSSRPGSITNSIKPKSLHDLLSVIEGCIINCKENCYSKLNKWELAQCAYLWSTALGFYAMLDNDIACQFKDKLKFQFNELPMKLHPKARMVAIVYPILGFNLTALLLRTYIKLRKKNLLRKTRIKK